MNIPTKCDPRYLGAAVVLIFMLGTLAVLGTGVRASVAIGAIVLGGVALGGLVTYFVVRAAVEHDTGRAQRPQVPFEGLVP
jgi:hypothetical protein